MRSKDWIKGALFGFGLTAVAGVGAGAFAEYRQETRKVAVDKDVMAAKIDEALAELAQIERLNDRSRDRKIRVRMAGEIAALRSDLTSIESTLDNAEEIRRGRGWDRDRDDRDSDRDDHWYDNDDYDDYGRDNHVSYTISDSEIDALISAMHASLSSASKLAIVREGISGRWITVGQLTRLMDELAFSNDRVDCAASLHANLSDPQNFYQVYSHLPFDADRDTLRKRIGK